MDKISIDIETFSSVDLKKSGMHKYVQSPDFEVLLFAYQYNFQPVMIFDLTEKPLPDHVIQTLLNPGVIKSAYNAAFEWYCLSKYIRSLGYNLDPIAWLKQWRCTMLHGLYCGFTAGLGPTGVALGLPQDKRKLGIGLSLIRTFCVPCKPTATNGQRTRTLPRHEPERWAYFKQYCMQDVVTEAAIAERLKSHPVPDSEQRLWELDQEINARGVALDMDLVAGALAIDTTTTAALKAEAQRLTGIKNPKSVKQLITWLTEETAIEADNLQKATVAKILGQDLDDDRARRVLEIRQQLGKSSVSKYAAMESAVCADGRARGLLQFYGANRTGRWSGRLIQIQNLPRNYMDTLDLARGLVRAGDLDTLSLIYDNIPDTLSQLIRTAFVPSPGHTFVVVDFSAIEARVIAWLAGETWRQEVFATHGKIYEASASAMFGVPIDKITKGNPEYALRAKGKVAELALGYQGAKGALIQMGALKMGLSEDDLPDMVSRWRQANSRIVDLWYSLERTAITCVQTCQPQGVKGLYFAMEQGVGDLFYLTIRLPSGRKLFYVKPYLAPNQWGSDSVHYWGQDQKTKKWTQQETYGGKSVENVTQAIARDCLAVSLERLAAAGYQTVMHIHDEAVLDCPTPVRDCMTEDLLTDACRIMAEPIDWAPGLLLRGDGFVSNFYKKD